MSIKHQNLATFHGVVNNPPNRGASYRVWEYFNKGSLYDLLYFNTGLKLTRDLKFSFIREILTGLNFLQNSVLAVHGGLNSKNCMVDARFHIKIGDFDHSLFENLNVKFSKNGPTNTHDRIQIFVLLFRNPHAVGVDP